MAKYSLWISDDKCNKVCVPLSRDGKNFSKKVELYEIDLLTVSLGKEKFLQSLKQSNIIPKDFDWESIYAYIQYNSNGKQKNLPLLFEKTEILTSMLNVQNIYRYHHKLSETKLVEKMISSEHTLAFFNSELRSYRDYLLQQISLYPEFLNNENLSRSLAQKFYSCLHSINYDEQMEYKNDILKNMMSYLNFRRLVAAECGCYLREDLALTQFVEEEDVDERDPDEEAFLTDDEKKMMYG